MINALVQITTRDGWSSSFGRPLELAPLTGRL